MLESMSYDTSFQLSGGACLSPVRLRQSELLINALAGQVIVASGNESTVPRTIGQWLFSPRRLSRNPGIFARGGPV